MRRRRRDPPGGIVLWKPQGMTSRHAVNRIERRFGAGPLGHTGTLDPLAAGILVLVGGEARKFQAFLSSSRKVYEARIVLGMESASGDAEGPLSCPVPRREMPARADIVNALEQFRGPTLQAPPALSAVRVAGKRAYERTRAGETILPAPRPVHVWRLDLTSWRPPVLGISVECGAGFYVRSFAADLGAALGTGGFLASLRRTAVGPFVEDVAVPLDEATPDHWRDLEGLLGDAPRVDIDADAEERLARGQSVSLVRPATGVPGTRVVWRDARVVGLAEVAAGLLHPRRWLTEPSASS